MLISILNLVDQNTKKNFFFFFYCYLCSPNARGSDTCRTLDTYTKAGLPECVVDTMPGPPPETTEDRTQTMIHRVPGYKLKFLTPLGIESEPTSLKVGTLPTTPPRKTKQRNFQRKIII